ncbi:hypothetical protein Salat_2797000 [Sesamum alatum]|uniref:Uncharacterized protein n=1 Tax=Sesamum alatum TaxID=300844 RepID=A0AAE1XL33_9LAMI|nr:hypothetical protein Salat_2797000 [Sesamum alatum]
MCFEDGFVDPGINTPYGQWLRAATPLRGFRRSAPLSGQGPSRPSSPRHRTPSLNTCGASASQVGTFEGNAYLVTPAAPGPALETKFAGDRHRGSRAKVDDLQVRGLEEDVHGDAEITDSESCILETIPGPGSAPPSRTSSA